MTHEELKDHISNVLEEHYRKDEHGSYYDEIYADYHDYIDEGQVREILAANHPKDLLSEKMSEWYMEAKWNLEDEAIQKLREDPELDAAFEENEDLFKSTLWDVFYVQEPYDHHMKQEVDLNIVLDTGNLNYDCVLDSFAHGYYGDSDEPINSGSSLLWLCEQQGISKEVLEHALQTGECYPKDMEDLLERQNSIHQRMRALGLVADKPMDQYNQTGAFKELLAAEAPVLKQEALVSKFKRNLSQCSWTYERFCEEWEARQNPNVHHRTVPGREEWEQRRLDVLSVNTEKLQAAEAQLAEMKTNLDNVLQDPEIAEAAKLRSQWHDLVRPIFEMKRTEAYQKGRLLETVIQESANVTTHMNTLTALVKMPLKDALDLAEVIHAEEPLNESYEPEERSGRSSITLSKDAVVGLYDPWNGAGSLFDIQLAKPLVIPVNLIHDANVDGSLGYGIQRIYGGMEYRESLMELNIDLPERAKEPLDQVLQSAKDTISQLPIAQDDKYMGPDQMERG